ERGRVLLARADRSVHRRAGRHRRDGRCAHRLADAGAHQQPRGAIHLRGHARRGRRADAVQGSDRVKDWVHSAIVTVLRLGVVLSVSIMLVGMAVAVVHHPKDFSSPSALGALTSPAAHFQNTLLDVISGVRRGRGQAIVMAGLLVLIATPVARVALSVVVFVKVRDRLYVAITSVVLLILLISFGVGLVAA